MFARKSNLFFCYILLNMAALLLLLVHGHLKRETDMPAIREKTALVKRLELTDLCLFTDARYTRNPAMADMNTPFQDHPMSWEHFPSGTVVPPPRHLREP